jgi:hypothetical protein
MLTTRAQPSLREDHLAAGRAGQKLAQRHQIAISGIVQPAAYVHELLAEISQVRDRTAEGNQPEFQKGLEYLSEGTLVYGSSGVFSNNPQG